MAWTNQSTNTLNVGPDSSNREITISTDGPISSGTEIDFYSGRSDEVLPAGIYDGEYYPAGGGTAPSFTVAGPVDNNDGVPQPTITFEANDHTHAGSDNITLQASNIILKGGNYEVILGGFNPATSEVVTGLALQGETVIQDVNGNTFHSIDYGTVYATTSASGTVTVPHTLTPDTPSVVTITSTQTGAAFVFNVTLKTSTSFVVTVYEIPVGGTCALWANHVVVFDWCAHATA